MGKLKIKPFKLIGFEKAFRSLTEARAELAQIWPITDKVLDTATGKACLKYTLLRETDDELGAALERLKAAGEETVTEGKLTEVSAARIIYNRGNVCFVMWKDAGFGWETRSALTGGFLVFFETWPGSNFKAGQRVEKQCRTLGWQAVVETSLTRGLRRMGSVDDLKELKAQAAQYHARMLNPERLLAERLTEKT